MGAISVDRKRISAVEREAQGENQARQEGWRTEYITVDDLPDDLRALSQGLDRLRAIRSKALTASKSLRGTVKGKALVAQRLARTQSRYRETNIQLGAMDIQSNVKAYNQMAEQNNVLVAEANKLQSRSEKLEGTARRMEREIAAYSQELTLYEGQFHPVNATYGDEVEDEVSRVWLKRTEEQLAAFQNDFLRMEIPVAQFRGSTTVDVEINDGASAPFVIDTGATLVTLTETLARKLQIPYDPESRVSLTLADGSVTEGYPVVLRSVVVSDARAEGVQAVVLTHAPAEGVQGLLGMTFLREFVMSFDANGNHLMLRKLKSR
jgi:clan AA aspartic protease (TIGR02281 family)